MPAELFGAMPDGGEVRLIKLSDPAGGLTAEILTLGAVIHRLSVPGRGGKLADVVLGAPDLGGYLSAGFPAAAVIGRVANRIKGAAFTLGGREYRLTANERANTLHSGAGNYAARNFELAEAGGSMARLTLRDGGEGGFPGIVDVEVTYSLADGALEISYRAKPLEDTPINITNHVYFNLSGHASGAACRQELSVNADYYTPADGEDIPLGDLRGVEGTPFDLRRPRALGEAMDDLADWGDKHNGFDHNFVLNGQGQRLAARACDPGSGRIMEVYTDLPGMQLYAGNFIAGGTGGKDGASYGPHHGFCLETQHFPNAVNQPGFPNCVVKAGEVFSSETVFRFSVR
jgi:aldose 1-epimerase